ncbi:arsenate reductase/protein-tyrosine-phosphatase family protein [Modestobacter roseus]|uniref:Protein-tyrosine phosphatase n=1 Tax=Modestobacter roseus TaxID=1181884 RepID=A0A562IL39_9ACTN|nr:hypothetical protein [Modestobacter roseus]TWH71546.1 protein-tyrosine phosphatase [Modestobacter roseus]
MLLVCTGNVCRSPAAELLLRSALDAVGAAGVVVTSAGTRALVGEPVHPPMAQLLEDAGAPTGSFTARQLTAQDVRDADLVLALAREHRSAVVTLVPGALRRSLLLSEAAAAAAAAQHAGWPVGPGHTAAARLGSLPALASRHRAPDRAAAVDVPDPYRGPEEVYRASFQLVRDTVDQLVRALR